MTCAEAQALWAQVRRLRDQVETLVATIETLSDPDAMRDLAESSAQIQRGEPLVSMEQLRVDLQTRREAEAS